MKNSMIKVLAIGALLVSQVSAHAATQVLSNYIDMRKVAENKYTFEACSLGQCRTLGNPDGYTAAEIKSQDGRMEQVTGVIMAIGGAVPIYFGAGVLGTMLGFDVGEILTEATGAATIDTYGVPGVFGGGLVGVSAATAGIYFLDNINPLSYFRDGHTKVAMQKDLKELDKAFKNGQFSIVLKQEKDSASLDKAAAQVEHLLHNLDFWRANPLPADINTNPVYGSSTFQGI